MYPLLPSQQPDPNAAPFPTQGRSEQTVQVEASAMQKKPEEDEGREEREILTEAWDRFRCCQEADQPWRTSATEELDFVDGLKHWTEEMRDERKGRPCLVFDRIGPSIDMVVNDARQNPPEAKVSPVGSGADKHTAEILQGLIRNVDNDSSASIAYMTAYEHAVKIGRGWWRVTFDYETEEGTEQKMQIKRISNPFSIYPDPAAEEFDYSDMRYCFATEDLDQTVFEEMYENAYSGTGEFQGLSDKQRDEWFPKGAVRVAEYWRVLTKRTRKGLLQNGTWVPVSDIPEGAQVMATRWSEKRTVECHKITGAQVLESTQWPGKYIPLVACLGREIIDGGKRKLRGMIRPSMDANLSYDYMRSKQVEAVGLAPLAPYIAAEGQLEGQEGKWASANRVAHSVLYYKPEVNGKPVPPPQRQVQEPAIQAITIAVQHADNDIKATLSTYDASLGNAGPESSGKAILARQREGDNAHFNYHDNLGRSIRHTARIELDLAPHIYSEERLISIYDPDGSIRQVEINKPTTDSEGNQRHYKIKDAARYDVILGTGPSYATRRQQGAANLTELFRAAPQPFSRALDLLVKALDIPDGDQIAERLRPPDIQQEQDGETSPAKQLQQVQAQAQQQGQLIQMLTGEVNTLSEMIKAKRLELESKERQTTQTNIAGILRAEISSKSAEAQKLAELDHAAVKHELDARSKLLHSDLSFEQEQQAEQQRQQHEKEQQQTAQQHDATQGEQQRQHDAAQSDQQRQHEAQLAAQAQAAQPPAEEPKSPEPGPQV